MGIRILACDNNRYQLDSLINHLREFCIKFNTNIVIDKAMTGDETLRLHSQNMIATFSRDFISATPCRVMNSRIGLRPLPGMF